MSVYHKFKQVNFFINLRDFCKSSPTRKTFYLHVKTQYSQNYCIRLQYNLIHQFYLLLVSHVIEHIVVCGVQIV